ncbi:unnamed protein product [Rhizoctonia solani]|uniref:Domain of unknown function at the cortex 1 domain-containing protein n=1 Tax=Rhizoctonia solani TaxID=456999 RepID=A0A8H2XIM8_9AGAM|nr:unnamed protein product [Rhizoctonia solani]
MAPSLKVSLGPNVDELKEVSHSDGSSHTIKSKLFDGVISVHIKGDFNDSDNSKSTYFNVESRARHTWSIGVQGRFLKEINGNDILFGNVFDRPLNLPWGFSAALNFAQYVDPTLEHDLYGEKPWALYVQVSSSQIVSETYIKCPYICRPGGRRSPFLSTMPYLQRIELDPVTPVPTDMPEPMAAERSSPPLAPTLESESAPAARRKYFTDESRRKEITFTSRDLIQADFVHGHLQFPSLRIALPGGVQFNLMYYYDERPVHFVCKERDTEETFFVVSFTVIKDISAPDQGDDSDITPVDSSDID